MFIIIIIIIIIIIMIIITVIIIGSVFLDFDPLNLMINLKFLLVISMLIQPLRSWELRIDYSRWIFFIF